MNENKEKREFAQQLEQIAETLTQAVKDNEGRAFILIGTDVKDNKDGDCLLYTSDAADEL